MGYDLCFDSVDSKSKVFRKGKQERWMTLTLWYSSALQCFACGAGRECEQSLAYPVPSGYL